VGVRGERRPRGGRASARREPEVGSELLEEADRSLLEVIDCVLNKGVAVTGEVMLGVAGVDLVYLRLSALLCAADRVLGPGGRDGQDQ
jgi:hypothetical protein